MFKLKYFLLKYMLVKQFINCFLRLMKILNDDSSYYYLLSFSSYLCYLMKFVVCKYFLSFNKFGILHIYEFY